jgi:hypothetical protein
MMKININNSYEFIDYMLKYEIVKEVFSIRGLHALYDYFEELYDDEDYDINAIDLCVHYEEYESIDEIIEDYALNLENKELSIEDKFELLDEYILIDIPDSKRFIIFKG